MSDFLTALGLVFVIEGVLYAVAPARMKRAMMEILRASESHLRLGGLIALGLGVALIWLVRARF